MTKARIQIIGGPTGNVRATFDEFLISSVAEQDAERTAVIETFGKPFVFSSGRFMQRYTFHGAVRGYPTNWLAEDVSRERQTSQHFLFQQFYDRHLRSTQMARTHQFTRVIVDEDVYDGYVSTLNLNREAATDGFVPFTFSFLGIRRGHSRSESDARFLLRRFDTADATAGVPALEELKADRADAAGGVTLEVSTAAGVWSSAARLSYTYNRAITNNPDVTFQVRTTAGGATRSDGITIAGTEHLTAVLDGGPRVVGNATPATYKLVVRTLTADAPQESQVITLTSGTSSVSVSVALTFQGDTAVVLTQLAIAGPLDTDYAGDFGSTLLRLTGATATGVAAIVLENPFNKSSLFSGSTADVRLFVTASGLGEAEKVDNWARQPDGRYMQSYSVALPGGHDYGNRTADLPAEERHSITTQFRDITVRGTLTIQFPRPADIRYGITSSVMQVRVVPRPDLRDRQVNFGFIQVTVPSAVTAPDHAAILTALREEFHLDVRVFGTSATPYGERPSSDPLFLPLIERPSGPDGVPRVMRVQLGRSMDPATRSYPLSMYVVVRTLVDFNSGAGRQYRVSLVPKGTLRQFTAINPPISASTDPV